MKIKVRQGAKESLAESPTGKGQENGAGRRGACRRKRATEGESGTARKRYKISRGRDAGGRTSKKRMVSCVAGRRENHPGGGKKGAQGGRHVGRSTVATSRGGKKTVRGGGGGKLIRAKKVQPSGEAQVRGLKTKRVMAAENVSGVPTNVRVIQSRERLLRTPSPDGQFSRKDVKGVRIEADWEDATDMTSVS